MKNKNLHYFFLFFLLFFLACEEVKEVIPKTSFNAPYPKQNRNLSNILGENLVLKTDDDTLELKITSFKKYNLVTNGKTGDTLFMGTVSRYRGVLYFSSQFNDTSWIIYAVKQRGNRLYGFNTPWQQTMLVESRIEIVYCV